MELFNLINQYPEITLKELARQLHLSEKQTYQRIKKLDNQGYSIRTKYYETGDISYRLFRHCSPDQKLNIYTNPKHRTFRALFLGDTHYTHPTENKAAVENAFDYAIQNNIHIIFHMGDFYVHTDWNKSVEESINYACMKYPYNPSITTFLLPGNHEYDGMYHGALNIQNVLKNKRYDVVPLRYQNDKIVIKNDVITLRHPVAQLIEAQPKGICFSGHYHKSQVIEEKEKLTIYVPACSNANKQALPGILDVTFHFTDNGLIHKIASTTLIHTTHFIKVHQYEKEIMLGNKNVSNRKNEDTPKIYIKK